MANVSPVIFGKRRPVGTASRPHGVLLMPAHYAALSKAQAHSDALAAELRSLGLGAAPTLNFIPGNAIRVARGS